ncbi:MAG: hypothetical protein PHT54_01630 [Candidatus Nanoarchaeia archaeon]|nr:hypothetical protein [Candidatus Nanoarchaeia archaeon]
MLKEAYIKSWKQLNLLLFVPDLIIVIVNYGLLMLFMLTTGLSQFGSISNFNVESFFESNGTKFIADNLLKIIIFLIVFAVTNFILGSGLMALKFNLIKKTVRGEKYEFFKLIKSEKGFLRVVLMRLYVFIIGTVLFILAIVIWALMNKLLGFNAAFTIMLILIILAVIIIKLFLLFRYADLFLDKKTTFKSLISSIKCFIRKPGYTILVLILLAVTDLILWLFSFGLTYGVDTFVLFNTLTWLIVGLGTIIYVLFRLVRLIWADLFLFNAYKNKFKQ